MRHLDRDPVASARGVASWALSALVVLAVFSGCEEDGASSSSGSSGVSATQTPEDQVLETWKTAGVEVSDFDAMAGAGIANGTCRAGQVAKMDTVICRYADAAAAKAARPAGITYIGETTGVALHKGPHLLVIADRNKADPAGKTINKVAKMFLGADKSVGAAKKSSKTESDPGKAGASPADAPADGADPAK